MNLPAAASLHKTVFVYNAQVQKCFFVVVVLCLPYIFTFKQKVEKYAHMLTTAMLQ